VAGRLELEGVDGILFTVPGEAHPAREPWLREVAGALFLPFGLEAPIQEPAALGAALAAGVDRVVLGPGGADLELLPALVAAFGRGRATVAVDADYAAGAWRSEGRDALAWMGELGERGAGEILLRAQGSGEALAALARGTAHLALPVLFRAGPREAAEALLHGVGGLVCPLPDTPRALKAAFALEGLTFRT
jgi:imidazole glycerol phosphate synthase subunit HisF